MCRRSGVEKTLVSPAAAGGVMRADEPEEWWEGEK